MKYQDKVDSMENKLNILVGMLNEIGADYDASFSITTRSIISSSSCAEIEVSVYFSNKTLKDKRILTFKSSRSSGESVIELCNFTAINLLRYMMFSKDYSGNGIDLGKNVPVEVFSSKTIFNRNGK